MYNHSLGYFFLFIAIIYINLKIIGTKIIHYSPRCILSAYESIFMHFIDYLEQNWIFTFNVIYIKVDMEIELLLFHSKNVCFWMVELVNIFHKTKLFKSFKSFFSDVDDIVKMEKEDKNKTERKMETIVVSQSCDAP